MLPHTATCAAWASHTFHTWARGEIILSESGSHWTTPARQNTALNRWNLQLLLLLRLNAAAAERCLLHHLTFSRLAFNMYQTTEMSATNFSFFFFLFPDQDQTNARPSLFQYSYSNYSSTKKKVLFYIKPIPYLIETKFGLKSFPLLTAQLSFSDAYKWQKETPLQLRSRGKNSPAKPRPQDQGKM